MSNGISLSELSLNAYFQLNDNSEGVIHEKTSEANTADNVATKEVVTEDTDLKNKDLTVYEVPYEADTVGYTLINPTGNLLKYSPWACACSKLF